MRSVIRFLLLAMVGFLVVQTAHSRQRYESFLSNGHQVIFFYPEKLNGINNDYKFEYDFSHQEGVDSVTFNFTVVSPQKVNVTDFKIADAENEITPKYYKGLFTEFVKGKYITRVQTSFLYPKFKDIFLQPQSPKFIVKIGDKDVAFEYKPSKWRKEHENMSIILNLFD